MGSSTEVAVTVPVPAIRPAVNTPLLSIVPMDPVVDQVTPEVEFVSVALNWTLDPTFTDAADGLTVTPII